MSYAMLPAIFRIFIGVFIDAKIFERKTITVFMNVITCVFSMGIAFRIFDTPVSVCWAIFINNFSH